MNDVNYIFPSYVVSRLRGGLAGLILAVIFAAAMSALAGELNSLATATMVDFYSRFVPADRGFFSWLMRLLGIKAAARDLFVSRLFTAFWGLFAAVVALQAGQLGSAIEVVNRFGSYFYGSILGVFGLAVLTPRASAPRGLLRRLRRHGGGPAGRLAHPARVPLVQRRERRDGVRDGLADHSRLAERRRANPNIRIGTMRP